jgi:hypothetical protein
MFPKLSKKSPRSQKTGGKLLLQIAKEIRTLPVQRFQRHRLFLSKFHSKVLPGVAATWQRYPNRVGPKFLASNQQSGVSYGAMSENRSLIPQVEKIIHVPHTNGQKLGP